MAKNVFCEVTVTFDHQILISSSLSPSGRLCQRYRDHKNGTDVRADGQPENITPPAVDVVGAAKKKKMRTILQKQNLK